jgi:hypothetical protein
MAKTQISRTPYGWVDNDNPTQFYASRRAARAARQASLIAQGKTAHLRSISKPKSQTLTVPKTAPQPLPNVTVINTTVNNLSSLQDRLYDRLTNRQGVSAADAFDVITGNGYNKAASYGHIREAGATHEEALDVVNLELPDVSLAYGLARAAGTDHADALQEALNPWTTHQWPVGGTSDGDD